MKTDYIGVFQVPDGYFGEKAIIHLCFDPQTHHCLEVHVLGFFRSCIPPATNKEEVVWLMQNHPACKNRFKQSKEK